MGVAVEHLNDRFNESVSQSINASNGLASQFQPSVPPREVVRCQGCSLVQFRTMSDLCRRCHQPLSPKLELDLGNLSAEDTAENARKSWPEAHSEEPQIGSAIKRLRRMQGVSQGELGRMVGLRRTYLSRVENDHVMPGPRIVSEIARVLGVGIGELFSTEPKPPRNGAVLAQPTCVRLVAMFSELQPREMAEIVSQARQMCAPGVTH